MTSQLFKTEMGQKFSPINGRGTMTEASSIRTRTYEGMKDDPLYQAWIGADKLYGRAVGRYAAEFKKRDESAKEGIREDLKKLFGEELGLTLESLRKSFEAYVEVYKEHPPDPMSKEEIQVAKRRN